MDKAGVAKSAHRAGVDRLRPRQFLCRRGDRGVSAALHRRVLGRRAGAPTTSTKMKHWLARGFSGMRLFTTGSTMPGQATWFDDPRTYAGLELRRRDRHAGLHADDAAGLPAIARSDRAFPEGDVSSSTIWRGRTWSMARRSPRIRSSSALSRYPNVYPQADAAQRRAQGLGQGHAGNVLPALIEGLRRQPHRLGLELPGHGRTRCQGDSRQGASGARASPAPPTATGFSARPR